MSEVVFAIEERPRVSKSDALLLVQALRFRRTDVARRAAEKIRRKADGEHARRPTVELDAEELRELAQAIDVRPALLLVPELEQLRAKLWRAVSGDLNAADQHASP